MKQLPSWVLLIALLSAIPCSTTQAQQAEQGAPTTPTTNNTITRFGAANVQKYDFFLSSIGLYWEHTYTVPLSEDTIRKRLRGSILKRPEVKQAHADGGTLVLEKWELDTKAADGRDGGFSKIYRSGKWSLLATITLHEGGYTVKCADIGYWWRGLVPGRYMIFKVESGPWRDQVTKNDAFRTKEEREILLVHQNLLKYFDIAQSK